MDPSYASLGDEDEEAAMVKAMGFSAFGMQGPAKKRKFNPTTDAVVEGQALVSLDKGGRRGQGSGGNQIPLGKTRVFGTVAPPTAVAKGDADEITLEEEGRDGGDGDGKGTGVFDTGLQALAEGEDAEVEDDRGPAYIDTSLPPPNEQARVAQEQIDAILASNPTPAVLPVNPKPAQKSQLGRGVVQFMAQLQEMPSPRRETGEAPPPTTSQQPRERGQRNDFWYVGYYDPSFNENPWARLEKANGFLPRGTWLETEGR